MTFGASWILWLVVPIVSLSILGVTVRERRRRRAIQAFGDASLIEPLSALPSGRRRAFVAACGVAAIALSLVTLARPRSGTGERAVAGSGADVLFLLDLSRSMRSTDVVPSRLDAAKAAARAIAAALPSDRVGLLVFAGDGFLQLPATVDRSTFEAFLSAASPADVPDPATNLEAAAGVVANVIRGDSTYTALVVLSDGEDNVGKLEGAIRTLQSAHVRTYAVGVGTTEGAGIDSGATTRLMEDNLRDIARRTGGVYARWSGPSSVTPVVTGLAQMPPRPIAGSARVAGIDRFQWPLALAFALLLIQ
ncbi:MAG TPA: VWA domain-containing protein [Gemmatimonadaceae bacterium]|nr:VWA domain-containing protein [Gemmatimonadaceae bacterium]